MPAPSFIASVRPVVLGSTSPYRRELLSRLKLQFEVAAPELDETALPGEAPAAMARRLALAKARAVAARFPRGGGHRLRPGGRSGGRARLASPAVTTKPWPSCAGCAAGSWCFRPRWRWSAAPTSSRRSTSRRSGSRSATYDDAEIEAYLRAEQAVRLRRQRPQRRAWHRAAGRDRERRSVGARRPPADSHLPHAARCRCQGPVMAADRPAVSGADAAGFCLRRARAAAAGPARFDHRGRRTPHALDLRKREVRTGLSQPGGRTAASGSAAARAAHHRAAASGPQEGRPRHGTFDARALLAPALAGDDMGLISEAGMPAVADPGSSVVRAAHELGIAVVPLVGPAFDPAGSGGERPQWPELRVCRATSRRTRSQRAQRIRELESLALRNEQTQLFIETPYRNGALWETLLKCLQPATRLAVASGLTLPQGRVQTRTVAAWRREPSPLANNTPAVFAIGR